MTASIQTLEDGRYGLYLGKKLIGIAETMGKAEAAKKIIDSALEDAFEEGFEDGRMEGYDNGLNECEDCTNSYDEGYEIGREEGLADGRSECDK
jgi:flagellar biosynthesis/type III secretory pathway protein FliH